MPKQKKPRMGRKKFPLVGLLPPVLVAPWKSGRGLPQSKTLARTNGGWTAEASWTAPALWRLGFLWASQSTVSLRATFCRASGTAAGRFCSPRERKESVRAGQQHDGWATGFEGVDELFSDFFEYIRGKISFPASHKKTSICLTENFSSP